MKLLFLLSLFILSGCVGEETLMGKDDDKNGVRDDVDLFIENTFKGKRNVLAAKQYAKYITFGMLNYNSRLVLEKNVDNVSKSIDCFHFLNPDKERVGPELDKILLVVLNSKERTLADKKADQKMAGSMHLAKEFKNNGCEFELQGDSE
jgi:hypothetical protein